MADGRRAELEAPRPSAAPLRRRLVIMAKAPVAGRVKTRLARDISVAQATRFARQSAAALLGRLARDPRWETTLAVAPRNGLASRFWPLEVPRIAQDDGNLGRRMQHLMDCMPPGPVVIVGTDIPGIKPAHIAAAFHRLGSHDAVFGAAADGGYWLVGLRRSPRVLRPFSGVRWSTSRALSDTLANLTRQSTAFVATLADVDDAVAYAECRARFGRRIAPVV